MLAYIIYISIWNIHWFHYSLKTTVYTADKGLVLFLFQRLVIRQENVFNSTY